MIKNPIISISTCTKGKGAIGIIRISLGDKEFIKKKIFKEIFRRNYIFPRIALFSKIYCKKEIDEGIIIYYPSPNSYNGETIIEIQMHNNLRTMNKLINFCIGKFKKYKIKKAKAGEFTKRAFLNQKINFFDLKKINNKYNLKKVKIIDNKEIKKIMNSFFNLRIYLENNINFVENEEINKKKFKKKISILYNNIKKIYFGKYFSYYLKKKKVSISIIGKCNTGKSTLFNKILRMKRSITSKKKGTTRDFLKENFKINNKKYSILDTAGIRSTNKKIEIKGIIKSIKIIKSSNIIILIKDINKKEKTFNKIIKKMDNIILVKNKIDSLKLKVLKEKNQIFSSAKYNIGINEIINKIKKKTKNKNIFKKNFINKYFRRKIKKCILIIKKILKNLDNKNLKIEIYCLKLKKAQNIIEKILNLKKKKITETIFKNFCIGK
ncbi:GTP-binding protein [Candidatus Vidania fulgoroideorum]